MWILLLLRDLYIWQRDTSSRIAVPILFVYCIWIVWAVDRMKVSGSISAQHRAVSTLTLEATSTAAWNHERDPLLEQRLRKDLLG